MCVPHVAPPTIILLQQEQEPEAQLREQLDECEASRRHLEHDLDSAKRELAILAERDEEVPPRECSHEPPLLCRVT